MSRSRGISSESIIWPMWPRTWPSRCRSRRRRARYRVFGAKPGSYGAGLLPLIDERNWRDDADFAEAYVNWGGYAYTAAEQGADARDVFRHRLGAVQLAL